MHKIILLLLATQFYLFGRAQSTKEFQVFPGQSLGYSQQLTTALKTDTIIDTLYTTYYAKKFEGRKTTSGQIYRASKFTAAHRTLPFGTEITIRNLHNGKIVKVKVNDRGPFSKKFELDISEAAAKSLGIYRLGYAKVEVKYSLNHK